MTADLERHNLAQIEGLSQRGGRTLSIIDLIEDGTLTLEMAALCWVVVEHGAGFITGAVPGGSGKTTLMATLLSFLPPGERIVTVSDRAVIDEALSEGLERPLTLLAHEIGSGHWFGYIWGRDAVEFLSLSGEGVRCVSCLHADTPEQTRDVLRSLGAAEEDLRRVRLQLFMRIDGSWGRIQRRVSGVYCFLDGSLRPLYRWQPEGGGFQPTIGRGRLCALLASECGATPEAVNARWQEREDCLRALRAEGVRLFAEVRRCIVRLYGA